MLLTPTPFLSLALLFMHIYMKKYINHKMYKNKWNESMRVALFWCIRWNKKKESFMSLVCARKLWWWHYLCWYAPTINIFLFLCMHEWWLNSQKFDGNAYEYIISIRFILLIYLSAFFCLLFVLLYDIMAPWEWDEEE